MKKILLYVTLWVLTFIANGCVVVHYPEGYWEWPENQRLEWREHHRLRWNERYERHHDDRREDERERHERY